MDIIQVSISKVYSQTYEEHESEESRGGKENISGQKFSRESNTYVALAVSSFDNMGSGTITTCMPAAKAAVTPFGESSNTRNYIV
jgi:hydroxymethylglutaryl-CoA reductase